MDLGIAGRKAMVCGASRGLGRGCAQALAAEGAEVWVAARTPETLERAVAEIRAAGGQATAVLADVTSEQGRAKLLEACPAPDILVNNAGGPPPGNFRDWTREDWIKAIDANMLSAIELIRLTIDGMSERRFGRIVNITSYMVKSPLGVLGLSNGARSGLTGFVGGLAREVAGEGVTVNNLLPGQFDTDRLRSNHEKMAAGSGSDLEQVRKSARGAIPAGRFGQPDEFGAACAFLCSEWASYITGQNILLDGGQYPGML
ncbi:MAG: SDR family oxidoreductase [Myxococcota bacterium]|nr:SDR family oxidoreductase [Myxococcota bacterium]